jgi:hypothetical protein
MNSVRPSYPVRAVVAACGSITARASMAAPSPLGMLRHMHLGAFAKLATRRYGPARQDQERMLVDVLRATCTGRYPLDEDWA